MAKYRKKPVVIEAMQWIGDNWQEVDKFITVEHSIVSVDPVRGYILIHTLEGVMEASVGDYIIKGVQGEFYPCKPHIFLATYELVEEVETNE